MNEREVHKTKVGECDMVRIWSQVLGRSVIATDDFFLDLGGNSIEALQLLDAVADEFGVYLAPGALFEQPTASALAAAIDEEDPERRPASAFD